MSNDDLLLGELKEFKRAQIEHNADVIKKLDSLLGFKAATKAEARASARNISLAISSVSIVLTAIIAYFKGNGRF